MLSFWTRDQFKHASKQHYYNFPQSVSSFNNILNNNVVALDIKSYLEHLKRSLWAMSAVAAAVVLPTYGLMQITNTVTPASGVKGVLDSIRHSPAGLATADKAALYDGLKTCLSNTKNPMIVEWLAGELKGSGGPALAVISMLAHNNQIRGIASIVAGAYCALSAKEDFEWARDHIVLDLCLQEKMIAVAAGLEALQALDTAMQSIDGLHDTLSLSTAISDFLYVRPTKNPNLERLLALLKTATFTGKASPLSRTGRILIAYSLMHTLKSEWMRALAAVGELDAYLSMVRLYKEFEQKRCHYCFVDFKEAPQPVLVMKEFWNPFIDVHKVVTNSLALGGDYGRQNVILTGPNAGGKSTVLRGIGINVFLAQTFGIAAASAMELTPFGSIATYFNIADDITAGNSMFKAEAIRAHYLVHKVEKLPAHTFSFIIADELFKGSSPREEEAAAYSVAKYLGSFPTGISILATHFGMLTTLEQKTPYFCNYKVSVRINPDGTLSYPFSLEPGVSNQHIALDVLRAEGFESSILNEAYAIVKNST